MNRSMEKYGTMAFDLDVMRQAIGFEVSGTLELGGWLEIVPEEYRDNVLILIDSMTKPLIGTAGAKDDFVSELHRVIHTYLPSNIDPLERAG